ncbi:hypothetical protein AGDE_09997 [Angomonas deanei]|nr:hypothetical protein AGDE_09997 [Angomonas deanei]|eukprot:EPY29355.1 hypothetical protein AGDE_09997 [Angomonas deanei]
MTSSILSKKTWRLKDILLQEGDEQVVRILNVTHPFRKQRLTIIPSPPFAKEEYYNDWVYQPYVKEHVMYVSNDIYNPFYVFPCRILFNRGKYPDYAYFHPMGFPDCIDVNLTRRTFLKREQPFKTPTAAILLTSNHVRDRRHPWVRRKVLGIVGEQYVLHPRDDLLSMVMVLPPAYIPDVLNTLQEVGFQVSNTTSASIGKTETIEQLNSYGNKGQTLVLLYLWFLIALFVFGESKHVYDLFQDYKREMVEKAGKDPKEMGL